MITVRVGVDVAGVDAVAASVARFGDRYLSRIYTVAELADCASPAGVRPGALAERFAAKEAVLKVLHPEPAGSSDSSDRPRPDWRTIEVRSGPRGVPGLTLTRAAARLAERAGVRSLSVSMTHARGRAMAAVAAVCET